MIHELGDDNDLYPDACGAGTSTKWAGELTMGLGYTDTTGGDGFLDSRNWTLVHCDRDGDGDFDNGDLSLPVDPNAPSYGFVGG